MLSRYSLRMVLFKSNRTLKRFYFLKIYLKIYLKSPAGGIWVIKNRPSQWECETRTQSFFSILCSSPGWTVLRQAQNQLVLMIIDRKFQNWAQINLSLYKLIIFSGFCCCNWQMSGNITHCKDLQRSVQLPKIYGIRIARLWPHPLLAEKLDMHCEE